MRLVVVSLLLLLASSRADAEPRAHVIAAELAIDHGTAGKVITAVRTYDAELDHLRQQRTDLRRRLVSARREDPRSVDRVLDDAVENQRALLRSEERLVRSLRAVLSPAQAAQALLLIAATEPTRDPITIREPTPMPQATRAAYDPSALWPPGSSRRGTCDPFSQMHRCPD